MIEWLRWKHIEDIDHPGDIYLSRLMLVRTPWFGVYFHIIRRPDWSRCQHDHPWSFLTIILRGGYVEEVGGETFTRRVGYVGYRSRTFEHSIVRLLGVRSYSLVLRGRNHEDWGFRTPAGRKVPWFQYMRFPQALRVMWCGEAGVSDHGSDQGVGRTSPILSRPVLWYRGAVSFLGASFGTHNAGVAGSNPAPAISEGVVRRGLARVVASLLGTSATTGATMYHENGRFVPNRADYKSDYRGAVERVYDAPFGVMPRAFHCARWSL